VPPLQGYDPQRKTMTHDRSMRFWDRIAKRYAARQIKDVAAYEALLADVAARLKPGDRVLEIGCGTGGTAIRLASHVASYTATDFSAEMISIAQSKPAPDALHFETADAQRALDDAPFDAICAFNVLHLVDDLPGLLRQIHSALKPGGLLISKTWCFADLGWKFRLFFAVLRLIGMFPSAARLTSVGLAEAVTEAGFLIIDQRIFGTHPQNPYCVAQKLG
jgi:SAM-dependent methyltransferase